MQATFAEIVLAIGRPNTVVDFSIGYINHQSRRYEMRDDNKQSSQQMFNSSDNCLFNLARRLVGTYKTDRKSRFLEIVERFPAYHREMGDRNGYIASYESGDCGQPIARLLCQACGLVNRESAY